MKKLSYKKIKIIWIKNSVFNSLWFHKLINQLMRKGKKEVSEKIFFLAIKNLRSVTLVQNLFFWEAIFLIKPIILTHWVRNGKTYQQLPKIISTMKQYSIAIFFFSLRLKMNKTNPNIIQTILKELFEIIFTKTSKILEFRDDIHKIGIYNQAFIRFYT